MDAALPFKPQGVGSWLASKPVANAATRPQGPTAGDVCYLIYNPSGQVDAFIGYGPDSASAVANAQIPLVLTSPVPAPTPGGGIAIAPTGTLQVLTLGPNLFFAAESLNSCSVWIQPGYGV